MRRENVYVKMDWWGIVMIVLGLVLIIFVLIDGVYVFNGWKSLYIIVIFIFGVLFLGVVVYIEGWVVE